jgi:hypothetical protein
LLLAAAAILVGALGIAGALRLYSSSSSIDAAEWTEVAPPELAFRALMPGSHRRERTVQQTPAGNVEAHKFSVEPKGKKELFMIRSRTEFIPFRRSATPDRFTGVVTVHPARTFRQHPDCQTC